MPLLILFFACPLLFIIFAVLGFKLLLLVLVQLLPYLVVAVGIWVAIALIRHRNRHSR